MNGDENSAVESKTQAEVEQNVVVQVSKEASSPVEQSDTTDGTHILSTGVVDASESKSDGKDFLCFYWFPESRIFICHSDVIIIFQLFFRFLMCLFVSTCLLSYSCSPPMFHPSILPSFSQPGFLSV